MGCLDGLCVDVKGWIVPSATIRCQMTKAITEKSDRQNSAYSNTSETVSAVTKEKQKQETKSDLKLVSSNWLGSNVDIDNRRKEHLRQYIMLTSGDCPTIVTSDKELDILLKQWTLLKVKKPPLLCKNDDKYTLYN